MQGIDPEERILLGQRPCPKIGDLGVDLLVEIGDLPAEMFSIPIAWASRSIFRIKTLLMKTPWTTAINACSDIRLSETKNGIYPLLRTLGTRI